MLGMAASGTESRFRGGAGDTVGAEATNAELLANEVGGTTAAVVVGLLTAPLLVAKLVSVEIEVEVGCCVVVGGTNWGKQSA